MLLVVDAALDDQDPVGHAELARGLVGGVEDDDLGGAGRVVEREEDHRVAALRRQVLDVGDDAADGDDLAVAAALELGERRVGLAAELLADGRERVLGDVEAERLLLEPQQLLLLELAGRDRRMVAGGDIVGGVEQAVEERGLAHQPVLRELLPVAERLLEDGEHPHPRLAGRVERAALDERLERALVDDLRVDALREVPDRVERPVLARRDDPLRGGLPHVLHRVQAEADLALDDGEVDGGRVDVGRQHLDPHLVAGVDVERDAVLRVHDARDERGHVLVGMVRLEPRGAVGDQRVARRVGLVEGVVLRGLHVLPELLGDRRA